MYLWTLLVHSWLRWAVIGLALWVIGRSLASTLARRPWTPADDRLVGIFSRALDVQVLIGLLLYFLLSPITTAALGDFVASMRNAPMRFWAVEHAFGILVGVALVHIGRGRVRKSADPVRKHRLVVIFFGLALVAILVSIPWPGTPNARPLLRW
jgi:hypothetical protein